MHHNINFDFYNRFYDFSDFWLDPIDYSSFHFNLGNNIGALYLLYPLLGHVWAESRPKILGAKDHQWQWDASQHENRLQKIPAINFV